MGYPTLHYNSLQADNDRIGTVSNVALPVQQQNQQFQRFQAFQQQQLQQFLQWQKKQFATALQQQTRPQQQQQQFPQPNIQQQQQYLQSQTPAAFPNQNVPQVYCNNSNGQNSQSNQDNQVSENNQVSNNSNQVGFNSQVSNNNQAGNSNNQVSFGNQAGYINNQVSYSNNQAGDGNNQASIPAPVAKLDISLDSGDLPPIPPLIEPHPLTKNFEDLRVLLHPIPMPVVERLSMTTASSLMRLCLDFEYRDLSADYPIALQLETKAWLMRYLRDLNAARRKSGLRLCRQWQKRLHQHTRVNPKTGLYEYVPDEVEVAGGTEKELKMLDHEAREELGNTLALFEENKQVLIPLIHPDWKFLQLRQNRGPSAKEWEDIVVDDIGELRRLKENAEREQREQEDAWSTQVNGNGDVAIVGSRMLSDEEMRMVAEQKAAGTAGSSQKHRRKPSKNIAAGSATPKKSPVKPKGQRKQHGRKKSLVAAKDKVTSQSSTPEADSLHQTAPIPDYPDDYGTGNMAAQRDKYSQMPVAASPATGASAVASHNNAATAALPSNNTSAQPTLQLPDYPDIYGPAIQTTNQNNATAAGPNTFTPSVTTTTTTPATAMPDYPPIYTTEGTNQHNAAAAAGPNTSAVTTTNTSALALPDYPPMYATESATETASISPSIQPTAASEADTTPAADPLPQVDGGFDPEDDGLDDLFEGELDE